MINGYQTRDNVISILCTTNIFTKTARQEASATTVTGHTLERLKHLTLSAAITCRHTGLPLVAFSAWKMSRIGACERWALVGNMGVVEK
jgi:hypothetical protein